MTIQAKNLKQWLKELGVTERGKTPSVRTETRIIRGQGSYVNGRYRAYKEFGKAYAVVNNRNITQEQIDALKAAHQYVQVMRSSIYTIIHN